MQQSLTLPEVRLRFFLKTLLIISLGLILFHVFPKWSPAFLSDILKSGYQLFSNGSKFQALLIVFLLVLIIGDTRRFGVLVRVFIACLFIDLIHTIVHLLRYKDPIEAKNIFYWGIGVDLMLILVLWILNRAAGRARYNLKYLSVRQFQTLQALAEVCIAGDSDAWEL